MQIAENDLYAAELIVSKLYSIQVVSAGSSTNLYLISNLFIEEL